MTTFRARWRLRFRLALRLLLLQGVVGLGLRVALVHAFHDAASSAAPVARILLAGTARDLLVGLTVVLPLVVILAVFRLRWLARPWRQHVIVAISAFALTMDAVVQYFFFEEYDARYNHLALDYLAYPDEVLGNIFASYDIPTLVALAAALAGALAFALGRVPAATFDDWSLRDRARALGITALLAVGVGVGWRLDPVSVAASRVDDEIAQNGWVQLLAAFRTAHLDYEAYYALVPSQDANARVARLVGLPQSSTGLVHSFAAHRPAPPRPLDVVVIIEESLGSSFSARFGHTEDDPVTPALDRWSGQGLALTNLVATGNRTVRGLEAVLCSFLPLPGDAVIKRDRSENIATIARVLAARGYATTFMYGGYGLFDNLKPFMLRNGFQAFVEQPQYPPDAFRTIWGVADEYVFDAMIAAQEEADRAGRPWFGTALTVSNHKPFDVPPGRVASPEGRSARRKAVLYADWALDRYLTQARREGLLAHTVLLVVGDHGARVYGAEQIPAESYRIPAFFLTPAAADRGTVIDRVASQVDLSPTLLSLAGISYEAPFFGRDLLGLPDEGGRAFVNHNRDVGLLTDTSLVVLGLRQRTTAYIRDDRHSDTFSAVPVGDERVRDLVSDAEAAYQVAYRTYRGRAYRLPSSVARRP